MRRDELQRMLDEAADQAATQAAALVISRMREALKAAIRDLAKDFWQDMAYKMLRNKWLRILVGILFLLGLAGLWVKEHIH